MRSSISGITEGGKIKRKGREREKEIKVGMMKIMA